MVVVTKLEQQKFTITQKYNIKKWAAFVFLLTSLATD